MLEHLNSTQEREWVSKLRSYPTGGVLDKRKRLIKEHKASMSSLLKQIDDTYADLVDLQESLQKWDSTYDKLHSKKASRNQDDAAAEAKRLRGLLLSVKYKRAKKREAKLQAQKRGLEAELRGVVRTLAALEAEGAGAASEADVEEIWRDWRAAGANPRYAADDLLADAPLLGGGGAGGAGAPAAAAAKAAAAAAAAADAELRSLELELAAARARLHSSPSPSPSPRQQRNTGAAAVGAAGAAAGLDRRRLEAQVDAHRRSQDLTGFSEYAGSPLSGSPPQGGYMGSPLPYGAPHQTTTHAANATALGLETPSYQPAWQGSAGAGGYHASGGAGGGARPASAPALPPQQQAQGFSFRKLGAEAVAAGQAAAERRSPRGYSAGVNAAAGGLGDAETVRLAQQAKAAAERYYEQQGGRRSPTRYMPASRTVAAAEAVASAAIATERRSPRAGGGAGAAGAAPGTPLYQPSASSPYFGGVPNGVDPAPMSPGFVSPPAKMARPYSSPGPGAGAYFGSAGAGAAAARELDMGTPVTDGVTAGGSGYYAGNDRWEALERQLKDELRQLKATNKETSRVLRKASHTISAAVEAEAGAAAGTQHAGRKHGREPLAYGPARDRVVASEVRELRGQVQVLKQALARERMAQLKGKEAAGKDKARMLQRLAGEMEELLRLEV